MPCPQVWARYRYAPSAIGAMESHRFGRRDWTVEYRPERRPYPWCLIDNGQEERE